MTQGTVLITGASSGIGRALAEEYSKLGANLVLIARRTQELQRVQSACFEINPKITINLITADVSQPNFVELLRSNLESVSDLRNVYVNAGVGAAGRFDKLEMQDYRRVFDVNVFGALHTVYGSIDALKRSKGRIVLISSLNGYFALPLGAPYNMSKFAIRALGDTLSTEFVNSGIGVTTVYPGPVDTEIFAIDNKGRFRPEARTYFSTKRTALPSDEAARRIIRGVRKEKRRMTLTFTAGFLVWFEGTFPGLTAFVLRKFYGKNEGKILRLIGKINPDAV